MVRDLPTTPRMFHIFRRHILLRTLSANLVGAGSLSSTANALILFRGDSANFGTVDRSTTTRSAFISGKKLININWRFPVLDVHQTASINGNLVT